MMQGNRIQNPDKERKASLLLEKWYIAEFQRTPKGSGLAKESKLVAWHESQIPCKRKRRIWE